MLGRPGSDYGAYVKQRRIIRTVALVALAAIAIISTIIILRQVAAKGEGGSRSLILKAWSNSDFQTVYKVSGEKLTSQPLSSFYLVMNGFSAYQLASAQINTPDTLKYIDVCVESLRKALTIGGSRSMESKICYVLGKAYYHKGPMYADLAVEYLTKAREKKYSAVDIDEYLGLAYASLHNYHESVVAFSRALSNTPSDLLLLSLAKSYIGLPDNANAKAYLTQCIAQSKDIGVRSQAKALLGSLLLAEGNIAEAEKQFNEIIAAEDSNADAHYYLGEISAMANDMVKARAEWRKALRIDPSHSLARSRLSI